MRTHDLVAVRVYHKEQFTLSGHVALGTFNLTCFRFKDTPLMVLAGQTYPTKASVCYRSGVEIKPIIGERKLGG